MGIGINLGKNNGLRNFKIESSIDEYKRNIGDRVHEKQIKFCTELIENFMDDTEENITVNTNRCGIGKSTTIKSFLNNLVNDYFYFGASPGREEELDCFGAIIIHDSIEGLERIAEYKGIDDRCYLMKFDKEDIETKKNSRMDFKLQLQEQFNYPIVLMTTQKYFKMSASERNSLYKWKKGNRLIKIIDEKPYVLSTTVIDEVYLSQISIALEEITKGDDKTYIINSWKKIRNDLDYIRDLYSQKYDVMWIKKEDKSLLTNKDEDKNFFNVLEEYVTSNTYDKIEAIKEIYSEGCLFVSSGDKDQDNKRQFVLLHNNIDKFDIEKCKCFVLDATSKFDIDYTISDKFKFLHIDDTKDVNDINIHHIQTSTSKMALLNDSGKVDTICEWINNTLGENSFIATYGKKNGLYQKFSNNLDSKEVAYFGNIKGKNDWENLNCMAHIGLNRKNHIVYLQKYILLKDKALEWNKKREEEIKDDIDKIIETSQDEKGWYVDEFMNKIMISDITVDSIQNVMRIKCRHFSNEEPCNIFMVCSKSYGRVVKRVADGIGAKTYSYIPEEFLAETTDNRKPIEGKERTNPQIIKEYLENVPKGSTVKIKDIIDGSGLSRKQIDKAREKNQWCKMWFENHKGKKSGQYIA